MSGFYASAGLVAHVTAWSHPYFGEESEMVRHELYDIQWLPTNATMFFAIRTDLVVVYWGAHVGILDSSAFCRKELDLGPSVMQANQASNQKNNCGRNLRASAVWAEGARNVELKGLPYSSELDSSDYGLDESVEKIDCIGLERNWWSSSISRVVWTMCSSRPFGIFVPKIVRGRTDIVL